MAEREPGQAAEMDFARLGLIRDVDSDKQRSVWVLMVTLAYSRHCFFWPMFRQRL